MAVDERRRSWPSSPIVTDDAQRPPGGGDLIEIDGLRVVAWIGATDSEQARPQALEVSLAIEPTTGFAEARDDLARTVDYHAVGERVRDLAAARPRRLIETLGEEIAALVLDEFAVGAVEVRVAKFILADTRAVAVRLRRSRRRPPGN